VRWQTLFPAAILFPDAGADIVLERHRLQAMYRPGTLTGHEAGAAELL